MAAKGSWGKASGSQVKYVPKQSKGDKTATPIIPENLMTEDAEGKLVFEMDDVLSPEDLKFFDENGYIVFKNAVPEENIRAVTDAIWEFLEMDRSKPEDWYRVPATKIGFVELYHHQAFWDTRTHPRIYKAFCQLWGSHKLWTSLDRACMKVPYDSKHPDWNHQGFVHWDMDPWVKEDFPFGLQGVLCLEDTIDNQGGFHCVPGMHKWLREWISKVPEPEGDRRQRFHKGGIPLNVPSPALKKLKLQVVEAKAGDLIIWRRELAHGNGHNVSGRPRLAQYINMFPARPLQTEALSPQECLHPETGPQRIHMWKNNLAPTGRTDTREVQMKRSPAELTELGKRLLGVEAWE